MSGYNIADLVENLPSREHWKHFGTCPRAGIVEYTARLATEQDWGIGDFEAVHQFLGLIRKMGMTVYQFLPLNDSGLDGSPYCTVSAFAIDPKYISINWLLQTLDDDGINITKAALTKLEKKRTSLRNAEKSVSTRSTALLSNGARVKVKHSRLTEKLPFGEIKKAKLEALASLWKSASKGITAEKVAEFSAENPWLRGYSVYCVLFEKFNNSHWEEWPEDHKYPTPARLDELYKEYADKCSFHEFTQYIACIQLESVHETASEMGIKLLGDLPLLLNRGSAEVWTNHHEFRLDLAAGAPPDQFSEDGQNWGFCPYNWPVMKQSNYALIRARMQYAARFYDANRIDHILGDFRIWAMEHVHLERRIWKESAGDGFYFPQFPIHGDQISQSLGFDLLTLVNAGIVMPVTPRMLGEYEIPWGYAIKWTFDKTDLYKSLSPEMKKRWADFFQWFREERQAQLWENHGMEVLTMKLEAAPTMLPVGEDLGDVPVIVRKTLRALGIPGMKVLRWENEYSPAAGRMAMADPAGYDPITLATVGVHDAETLRHWWIDPSMADILEETESIHARRRENVAEDLKIPGFTTLTPEIHTTMVEHRDHLDYMEKKVDLDDYQQVAMWLDTPTDMNWYESLLKRRIAAKGEERQKAWEDLGYKGAAPDQMPLDAISRMIQVSYYSSSVLAINPLTDILSIWGLTCPDPRNDRINKPGIVDSNNWETRLPWTVQEMTAILDKVSPLSPSMTMIEEARALVEGQGRLPYPPHCLKSEL
ncbi:MAG: hypothetical protein CVV64_19100 [Candidatus Wallbacteria bacterium HGW-Wallbacteria-1]|jgi:4-alpha-glucanotransferase|uniref:4-alpha-glucanotransferase n=1 Tax=Candidatus Wallbacteria bacterium HGW-Wallbacteria-1 TaxID=2013854 RepID=A0A2N1PJ80_9BACT|nr:MAG: hypothetical protein CVV64_19100 [Candidatus Wallbacteria bacterium HGW-Wallbacteria-1]